jgi:TetR/AcrR family transcriptional regulator, copper-responsive repressor
MVCAGFALGLRWVCAGFALGLACALMNRPVVYDDEGTLRMQELLNYLVRYLIMRIWGRPKNFSREEVLEKAMPIFWKRGFPTRPFRNWGKPQVWPSRACIWSSETRKILFVACLRHYLKSQEKRGLLTQEPLGWNNVETFLKSGPLRKGEQQGCFSVNSIREFAILPEAYGIVTENRALVQRLLAISFILYLVFAMKSS